MKKVILFFLVVVLMTGTVIAQGFYFRAGGTYGLPVGTSVIGEKYNSSYDGTLATPTTTASTKAVSASYGEGPNFAVAVGYKFNQNFMFDLSGQYLIGNKYHTSSVSNYKYPTYSSVNQDFVDTKAKGFFLNPSFVFSAGFGKAAPYGRFGLVVGAPQISKTESYYDNGDGIIAFDKACTYKKGFALGYQAAIGMNWKLSEKFDIYTEVNILNMTWYAKQSDLTKFMNNGQDALASLTVSQKQTNYAKSYDPSTLYDPTKPYVQLREASPFSAISINVGIRYTMFQKKDE
jgi:hypothetical protein